MGLLYENLRKCNAEGRSGGFHLRCRDGSKDGFRIVNSSASEVLGSSTLNRGAGQQPHPEAGFGQQQWISPHFYPKLVPKTRSSHHISVDHGLTGCYLQRFFLLLLVF